MKLTDYLNDINHEKKNLIRNDETGEALKGYNPWVINKALSFGLDTVLYADEMNLHYNLDKDLQYDFYIHSLRKKKRFNPWLKADEESKEIALVAKYFKMNMNKARSALKLLTKEQLETIKKRMEIPK